MTDNYGYLPFEQGNLYEPYESMKNTNSSLDVNRMHEYAGWTNWRPPGWSQAVDARNAVTNTATGAAGSLWDNTGGALWNKTGGAFLSSLKGGLESGQKTVQAAILIPMVIVGVLVLAVGVVVIVKVAKK